MKKSDTDIEKAVEEIRYNFYQKVIAISLEKPQKIRIDSIETDPIFLRTSYGFSPETNDNNNKRIINELKQSNFKHKSKLIEKFLKYDKHDLDLNYIFILIGFLRVNIKANCKPDRKQVNISRSIRLYEKVFPKELKLGLQRQTALILFLKNEMGDGILVRTKSRKKPELIEPLFRIYVYFLQSKFFQKKQEAISEVLSLGVDFEIMSKKDLTLEKMNSYKTLFNRFEKKEKGIQNKITKILDSASQK